MTFDWKQICEFEKCDESHQFTHGTKFHRNWKGAKMEKKIRLVRMQLIAKQDRGQTTPKITKKNYPFL